MNKQDKATTHPWTLANRNNRRICQVTIGGTYLVTGIATLLFCLNLCTNVTSGTIPLGVFGAAFLYIIGTHILIQKAYYRAAAYMILALYTILATGIVLTWGINTPIGLLLFGLAVVLAGILLTARHALYMVGIIGLILLSLQVCLTLGILSPVMPWASPASGSSFGDVFAYGSIYSMLALVSWLFNREMETSLKQARQAQQALLRQTATLELQVQHRTEQLRKSQLEELQQMYRVTELGQIGIGLLHDLANNITALQIEIEGLKEGYKSDNIEHARRITDYLGDVIENTRSRIHGIPHKRSFDLIKKTNETIALLRYKAIKAKVDILWQPSTKPWRYRADPVSYGQVLTLLISNAIDAYDNSPANIRREVRITMDKNATELTIAIGSWSKIDKDIRKYIFKPFKTSKKTGMGVGLYIAKQTTASQLGGTLTLRSSTNHYTEFMLTLPL